MGMQASYSAIILAGGDGARLRSLTRAIAGDDRPKQFCPVVGDGTLLDQTCRRVALADCAPDAIVTQPANRGTAPAIFYALLRLDAGRVAASWERASWTLATA